MRSGYTIIPETDLVLPGIIVVYGKITLNIGQSKHEFIKIKEKNRYYDRF